MIQPNRTQPVLTREKVYRLQSLRQRLVRDLYVVRVSPV